MLSNPIIVRENEGEDRLKAGTDDTGSFAELDVPQIPLYAEGSVRSKITASGLFPDGLGDPAKISAFFHLNQPLGKAHTALQGAGHGLAVVSGFLSPGNQLARWRVLYAQKDRTTPWKEIEAGRYADSAGSVASVVEDDKSAAALLNLSADVGLVQDLQRLSGQQDVEPLLKELLQYRANSRELDVSIDPKTATSVHNLGHSVNTVLTTRDGTPLNMGTGIDIVSPAQAVAYFEQATAGEYEALVESDPLLANYLLSLGVTKIDETTMQEVQGNRRMLFAAMRGESGFDFYRGEQGHFSLPRPGGNHPSREYVYGEAEKSGYKIV